MFYMVMSPEAERNGIRTSHMILTTKVTIYGNILLTSRALTWTSLSFMTSLQTTWHYGDLLQSRYPIASPRSQTLPLRRVIKAELLTLSLKDVLTRCSRARTLLGLVTDVRILCCTSTQEASLQDLADTWTMTNMIKSLAR